MEEGWRQRLGWSMSSTRSIRGTKCKLGTRIIKRTIFRLVRLDTKPCPAILSTRTECTPMRVVADDKGLPAPKEEIWERRVLILPEE
ncbi:hypothetical protein CRG98_007873 [Punica granatum]|uniref:Uncharacterized protein n=1 Tax=Punica granatum TaxID=22663 RepID=A0A2I0KTT8_PUNGR|nr:hypothetical protein CRG98_007873 [Punica granatum]